MKPKLAIVLLESKQGRQFVKNYWEMITNNCTSTAIQPAIYSKAQDVNKICECLKAYPEQKCNTPESLLYTLEFTERDNPLGPVGTANEINAITEMDVLFIWTKNKGCVWIEFTNGKWKIVETVPDAE